MTTHTLSDHDHYGGSRRNDGGSREGQSGSEPVLPGYWLRRHQGAYPPASTSFTFSTANRHFCRSTLAKSRYFP